MPKLRNRSVSLNSFGVPDTSAPVAKRSRLNFFETDANPSTVFEQEAVSVYIFPKSLDIWEEGINLV